MKFNVDNKEFVVEKIGNSIIVNGIKFNTICDFIYFVNKLTDIAEELTDEI